jgi:hypothetical protein
VCPSCGGVIEESHKPATVAIGITRFSVGTYLLLHLQKDDSVQQLAAHVATPRAGVWCRQIPARLAMKGKPKVVTTGLGPIGLTAASLVRNIRLSR